MAVSVSCKINNIAKRANSVNNGAKEMKFISLDSGDDGEYNGGGFVDISVISAMQHAYSNDVTYQSIQHPR